MYKSSQRKLYGGRGLLTGFQHVGISKAEKRFSKRNSVCNSLEVGMPEVRDSLRRYVGQRQGTCGKQGSERTAS